MKTVLIAGITLLAGVALGYLLSLRTISRLRRRVRELLAGLGEPPKKRETMKVIVWTCVLNGFAWIWCSYILAALDKAQIAETLSTAAVTEIIGAVLAYALKSLVENLSKNNHWPDKRPVNTQAEPEADATDNGDAVG